MPDKFQSLAEVLEEHRVERTVPPGNSWQWWKCAGCEYESDFLPLKGVDWEKIQARTASRHQAVAWREACTIRTVEELDTLPDCAVVRTAKLGRFQGEVCVKNGSRWDVMGYVDSYLSSEFPDEEFPALLIWHPDWRRP